MKSLVFTAALLGASGVALGAFGAHALKARVDAALLATWQTGVLYHLVHAVAILAIALALAHWPSTLLRAAGWSMVVGSLLFSGSLYLLVLTGFRLLGAVTPLGGLAFIIGWLLLAVAAWKVGA